MPVCRQKLFNLSGENKVKFNFSGDSDSELSRQPKTVKTNYKLLQSNPLNAEQNNGAIFMGPSLTVGLLNV